jgi:hypothetical protein
MFENPRMIHITVEIVLLLAVVFWMTSNQRKVEFHLRTVLKRLQEQEDRISSLERQLSKKEADDQPPLPLPLQNPLARLFVFQPPDGPAKKTKKKEVEREKEDVEPAPEEEKEEPAVEEKEEEYEGPVLTE